MLTGVFFKRLSAVFLLMGAVSVIWAEMITGTSVMRLSTPATPQIRNEAVMIAADSLKTALSLWLHETGLAESDLKNPIKRHFFSIIAKSCIQKAKQDSYFEGRDWILNLDIKDDDVREIVTKHNAWCDSLTQENWKEAQTAMQAGQYPVFYRACVQSLFYAAGVFVKSAPPSAAETGARAAMQEFLKTLVITCSQPIISGKLGQMVETEITFTAKAADMPLPGLALLARLPDGTKIASLTTGADGTAKLENIRMPFVAYGTFLHVVPNFGAVINSGYTFEADAFGIRLGEGHEQTLIFNIVKPVYSLNYRAVAANKVEVPADFSSDAWLRKFLEDSCHMQPMTAGKAADITLDVRCQVSSYSFDEREQTDMKVEVQASAHQGGGGMANKTALVHKKTYDSNHPIPTGQFFWEASNNLKVFLKQMLIEL